MRNRRQDASGCSGSTRGKGGRCSSDQALWIQIYVDLEISADGQQSLNDAHAIAERVHHMIGNTFQDVKHCMVRKPIYR